MSEPVQRKRPTFAHVGLDLNAAVEMIKGYWEDFRHPWSEALHTPLDNLLERQQEADRLREWTRDCLWCIQHSDGTEGVSLVIHQLVDPLDWNTEGKHLNAFLCDARRRLDGEI